MKVLVTSIKFCGPIGTKPKCSVDTGHSHDHFGRNLNAGQQNNMNKTTNDTASSAKVSKAINGMTKVLIIIRKDIKASYMICNQRHLNSTFIASLLFRFRPLIYTLLRLLG